jgi:hypothetical protein
MLLEARLFGAGLYQASVEIPQKIFSYHRSDCSTSLAVTGQNGVMARRGAQKESGFDNIPLTRWYERTCVVVA